MTQPRFAFLDLKAPIAEQRAAIDAAIARVLDSGWLLLGKELDAFEQEWATYCQAAHGIGLANGLDALALALEACGVKPGDDVLVPANTYIASWLAVSQVGARPVPVEPDPRICNLDPDRLLAALTPRTTAIMPVHLYGQSADLDPILAVAVAKGLAVVEDAAQSHGARYRGRRVGGCGSAAGRIPHAVAWSFYPTKNLGALGDGGAVTTDDATIADRLRMTRNYGQRQRYVNEVIGRNSRLEEMHAAVLRVKLTVLDEWNTRRATLAAAYQTGLAGLNLDLPFVPDWAEPVWHQYVVRHPQREALRQCLADRGIPTIVHYPVPPHRQAAYAHLGLPEGCLPISERLHREVLSLPMGPHLSADEQAQVISAVRAVVAELG